MLTLTATELLNKRKTLIDEVITKDYDQAINQISTFFNNIENLMGENPSLLVNISHAFTKDKVSKELIANGFTVENEINHDIYVVLKTNVEPVQETVATVEPEVTTKPVIEIPDEAVEVEQKPVAVTVTSPKYSHTDLQMSGGSPF